MSKSLILASQSPRRKELLERCHVRFTTEVADIDETLDPSVSLEEAMEDLAWRKAEKIFEKHPDSVVIGADTIVVLDQEVLGKPKDEEDAFRMLSELSGNTHQVMTGVCIVSSEKKITFCDSSDVEFYPLTEQQIRDYISTKEPMDKAGAYGIQGEGFFLIRKIDGDFYSIMGFPAARVLRALKEFDI